MGTFCSACSTWMVKLPLGRAMVRQPEVFLMDEPLSNLDAKLRVQMRGEISRLQKDLAITTVYVTHDQVEAMTLADRIVILNGGHVEQVGPPLDVYQKPATTFVATFIGQAVGWYRPDQGAGFIAAMEDVLETYQRSRDPDRPRRPGRRG